MLTKKEYTDKYGNKVVDYRITNGDTFILNVKPLGDISLIKNVEFKLGDYDYIEIMTKQFVLIPELSKYTVTLTSKETDALKENETYRYQIVITNEVDKVETVMSGKLTPTYSIEPEEEK